MRRIFPRLLLSFFLTFLLASLLSGLVLHSFSRTSVESIRNQFRQQQQQANLARSTALMGQAAYVMWEHRGIQALEDYTREIASSMRTRLFLVINDQILPQTPHLGPAMSSLMEKAAAAGNEPTVEEENGSLQVLQRLQAPDGSSYVIMGLHQTGPPPGPIGPPPPGGPHMGAPPPPPPDQQGLLSFVAWLLGPRFLIFFPLAGIFCFLLARSFSAPLNRLRQVSRQIAEGDLTARIGTSLGKQGNEIGDLGRDFDRMAERLERLVIEQRRLLLDISHELRSPLARLRLSLELVQQRCPDDANLARIDRESERMNVLIEQLLTLTHNEKEPVDATTLPLAPLLQEITEDVEFEHRDKAVKIEVLELAPLTMAGSRQQLREAVENIVRNGAYYTAPGTTVEVSMQPSIDTTGKQWAGITVRDHGPGVAEEKLPFLTEPFYRVDEARVRNSGGMGLGLAIAQKIISQHGGTLLFANAANGEGLIVEIVLPLGQHAAQDE